MAMLSYGIIGLSKENGILEETLKSTSLELEMNKKLLKREREAGAIISSKKKKTDSKLNDALADLARLRNKKNCPSSIVITPTTGERSDEDVQQETNYEQDEDLSNDASDDDVFNFMCDYGYLDPNLCPKDKS